MSSPAPVGLRGARAAIFGSSALVLAAAAHVLGGGTLPSLPLLLAVGIPVACASVVLARRTRGPAGILLFLAVGQALMHEIFMTTGSMTSCAPAGTSSAHAPHGMSAVTCAELPAMTHAATGSTLPPILMLALHALAIAATALMLAHGERVALRLWAWCQPRPGFLPPQVPACTRGVAAFRFAQFIPALVIDNEVSRRGPPRASALVLTLA